MADSSSVQILKNMLILVLTLAWVPLTSHCQLELVPGLEFLACSWDEGADNSPAGDPCADEGCCSIESATYYSAGKSQTFQGNGLALLPAIAPPVEARWLPTEMLYLFVDTSPPGIPVCWQFSLRTALPVRAPSLAS